MSGIQTTLDERGKRYGDFLTHADITQDLKHTMQNHNASCWDKLQPDQMEALDMIGHKIGRILNGDPNYDDSWHDIAGYAELVAERLRKRNTKVQCNTATAEVKASQVRSNSHGVPTGRTSV